MSIEAREGITGILGPNGAGKTTLLKCIVGILSPNSGKVFYGSIDVLSLSEVDRAKILAYVPQELPRTFPYTVFEMVLMGRNPHVNLLKGPTPEDELEALKALRTLGIESLKDRYYNSLSGGEKRLVLIARAIAQGGKVLIMDEPTSFLDYGNQLKVMKLCREISRTLGKPILISIHDPNLALRYCDYVYLMSKGRVVQYGRPEEAITPEVLKEVYGVRTSILEQGGRKYVVAEERALTLIDFDSILLCPRWGSK